MQPIANYFSATLQERFAAALPRLRRELAAKPFAEHDATFGAAGETLRAFRNHRRPPSAVFRGWATVVCRDFTAPELAQHLESQATFDAWHRTLVEDLASRWRSQQGRVLSVAHKNKLVDLLVKWLSAHDFGSTDVARGFERHAHCALDRQTLKKLNECLSLALPIRAPSMGDIHSEQTYSFCQGLVAEFAASCGGTPLLFDYFAWKRGG